MMQSDFHGSMATLFSTLRKRLVHPSFLYNVKILEITTVSSSHEKGSREGTEDLTSLTYLQRWLKMRHMLPGCILVMASVVTNP